MRYVSRDGGEFLVNALGKGQFKVCYVQGWIRCFYASEDALKRRMIREGWTRP